MNMSTKVKCYWCGKVLTSRVPKGGDGSLLYPRRHSVGGVPCPGNIEEAIKYEPVLKDLKKGDKFEFNDKVYIVTRKYISDDLPMIAKLDHHIFNEARFHNGDLKIVLIL